MTKLVRGSIFVTALTVGGAIAGFTAPASAAIVNVTYYGSIASNGVDNAGLFGPVGSLASVAFTAHFTFDTSLGIPDPFLGSPPISPIQNSVVGGTLIANTSPALTASIIINGNSVSIPAAGGYFSRILGYNDGAFSQAYHQVFGADSHTWIINSLSGNSFCTGIPATIDQSFSATGPACGPVGSSFQIYDSQFGVLAEGGLLPNAISVTVPEPAAIVLFCVGIAGLSAVRRRWTK